MSGNQNLDKKIYVGNLPENISEQLLFTVFLTFGDIKSVEIPREADGRHKGFGFIEFEEAPDSDQAIDNMQEAELFGSIIKVQRARKTVNQQNRAIWDDKDYQAKYMNVETEKDENTNHLPEDPPTASTKFANELMMEEVK
jgi:peptidyl-prolyl isomerase E (cyclophilin E)